MKKILSFILCAALLLSLAGCAGENDTSSEQTVMSSDENVTVSGDESMDVSGGESTTASEDESMTPEEKAEKIMAEHPDAEKELYDGNIWVTYYEGSDHIVELIFPNGSVQTTNYGPDFYRENFPSYEEVQAEYPGKEVLVWVFDSTLYERRSPLQTRKVNEYLDGLGCGFAVCFKPVNFEFNGKNHPHPFLYALEDVLASGEQVDLVMPHGYEDYVFNGLFERLDGYFETDSGRELYESLPEKMWESLKINGGIYGVSGCADLALTPDWGYFVNAGLAEKYGWDIEKPIEEQLDIIKSVKENEENVDAFAMYANDAAHIIGNSNVRYMSDAVYWNAETNSAACALDDPAYMDKLRLYDAVKKTLVNNKSVLKEIGTSKSFFIMEYDIAGGKVGYEGEKTVDIDYEGNTVTAIPVFREKTMVRNSFCPTGIYSGSEHKEAAVGLLAKIYSDPVLNNLLVYGVEGENYVLENGIVKELPVADGIEGFNINPFSMDRFGNRFLCHRSSSLEFSPEKYIEIFENAEVYEDFDFVPDTRSIQDEMNAVSAAEDTLKLSDVTSLDEVLSAYRDRLYKAGLQTIIDEYNRQYEVYKNEKG